MKIHLFSGHKEKVEKSRNLEAYGISYIGKIIFRFNNKGITLKWFFLAQIGFELEFLLPPSGQLIHQSKLFVSSLHRLHVLS